MEGWTPAAVTALIVTAGGVLGGLLKLWFDLRENTRETKAVKEIVNGQDTLKVEEIKHLKKLLAESLERENNHAQQTKPPTHEG